MCYSTYGIKSLGSCGSSEMIAISMNQPGCKKPHVLDILGNACCSTCQRTRSQLCLMILTHRQGLKNANENFKKKWSFKTSINSLQFWQLYNFTGKFSLRLVVSVFTFQSIPSKSPLPCRYGANRPGPWERVPPPNPPEKKSIQNLKGGVLYRGVPAVPGSGNQLYFCYPNFIREYPRNKRSILTKHAHDSQFCAGVSRKNLEETHCFPTGIRVLQLNS